MESFGVQPLVVSVGIEKKTKKKQRKDKIFRPSERYSGVCIE